MTASYEQGCVVQSAWTWRLFLKVSNHFFPFRTMFSHLWNGTIVVSPLGDGTYVYYQSGLQGGSFLETRQGDWLQPLPLLAPVALTVALLLTTACCSSQISSLSGAGARDNDKNPWINDLLPIPTLWSSPQPRGRAAQASEQTEAVPTFLTACWRRPVILLCWLCLCWPCHTKWCSCCSCDTLNFPGGGGKKELVLWVCVFVQEGHGELGGFWWCSVSASAYCSLYQFSIQLR